MSLTNKWFAKDYVLYREPHGTWKVDSEHVRPVEAGYRYSQVIGLHPTWEVCLAQSVSSNKPSEPNEHTEEVEPNGSSAEQEGAGQEARSGEGANAGS